MYTSLAYALDPFALKELLWPNVRFYSKQRQAIRSVRDNVETVIAAGNKLGKDYVAGFLCLWFFLTRHPVRIVTTSAGDQHLAVLWGEIGRFIDSSRYELDAKKGGVLILNHQDIGKMIKVGPDTWVRCKISYMKGMVASQEHIAKMQGHHATPDNLEDANDGLPRAMFVGDECSSVMDDYYNKAITWSERRLLFGNCWPCSNFFFRALKGNPKTRDRGGDLKDLNHPTRYLRKVHRWRAEDSPNVRYALEEIKKGLTPSNRILVPGVKPWNKYQEERETQDAEWLCVAHGADFYEGPSLKLFPPEWLNYAEELHDSLEGKRRQAVAIGIDPGEGEADTTFVAVDEYGVIEVESLKTPDTSVIDGMVIDFGTRHNVRSEDWCIDRGGGGKHIADRLRAKGYEIRTVPFGGEPWDEGAPAEYEKQDVREIRYTYRDKRARMYGEASLLLDPKLGDGYAIPREYAELRRQLGAIPKWRDEHGRLFLPPKQRRDGANKSKKDNKITMNSLLGRSPDEADAFVLAVYGMQTRSVPGVFVA